MFSNTLNNIRKYGVGAVLAAAGTQAMAALPAGATTALTSLETDAGSLIDAAWGPLLVVAGGFALMKLGKRAIGRAS
jgi:hypothetical protein